jgi:hypothetical protein
VHLHLDVTAGFGSAIRIARLLILTPGWISVLGDELDAARSSGTAAAADAFDSTTTRTPDVSAK